jgi:hypothetical protein
MPGKYLKSAARACAGKAKFETQAEAERIAEYRFRAYQCPVCHAWHLTRRGGAPTAPTEVPPEVTKEPGPKLADLDWSELASPARPKRPSSQTHQPPPKPEPTVRSARVIAGPDRGHRYRLNEAGRVVKSAPVADARLRARVQVGQEVALGPGEPPPIWYLLTEPT